MNASDHSQILQALGEMSANELGEISAELQTRFDTNKMVKLHLFDSVKKRRPSVYYDAGPQITILLVDPGPNLKAFTELMQEYDKSFDLHDAVRLRLKCHRKEWFQFRLDQTKSAFIQRLQDIGAEFEYEEDYVDDYKTVVYDALPQGFEETLYEALSNSLTSTIYSYRAYVESDEVPYAPEHTFVFSALKTDAKGDKYRLAYSRLTPIYVRTMQKRGMLSFDCKPTGSEFIVRINSKK